MPRSALQHPQSIPMCSACSVSWCCGSIRADGSMHIVDLAPHSGVGLMRAQRPTCDSAAKKGGMLIVRNEPRNAYESESSWNGTGGKDNDGYGNSEILMIYVHVGRLISSFSSHLRDRDVTTPQQHTTPTTQPHTKHVSVLHNAKGW